MEDKFILSSERFANSPTVDYYKTIQLKNKTKTILNDENVTNIELSELANIERENSYKYRLLGSINYFSLLNNLKNNYTEIQDFFVRYNGGVNPKNIFNSFKIYVTKKSTEYVSFNNDLYKETYEIISELKDINIYNCGFSRNIFNEQTYLFNFNITLDLKDQKDYFNKPITELFLFFDYQLDISKNETVLSKDFNSTSKENKNLTITKTTNSNYDLNDLIVSNLIKKEDNDFDEKIINEQEYKIKYNIGSRVVQFKYNPFIKIKLRDYNDAIYNGNLKVNSTNTFNIPDYAKLFGDVSDENVLWKEILPHGFIDPITDLGVNHPFINGVHYVYTNNVFSITPDFSNLETEIIFKKQLLQGYTNDLYILNENPNEKC